MTSPWILSAFLIGAAWADPTVAIDPVVAIGPAGPALEEGGEGAVLVTYDITGLTQGPVENQVPIRMLPLTSAVSDGDGWFEPEHIELGDVIESLVYDIVAPEAFEYEGRSFQRLDDGRIVVVAPPALQTRIAELIEGFRTALGRTARIGLDVYAVAPGRAFPTVLDQDEIETLVNSGTLRLVHRRQDQVRMGYTERIEALNSTTIIESWEGEIAQTAAIPRPELRELDTGIDLLVRVEDVPGSSAVRVRQALSVTELSDMGTEELSIYNGVRLDNTIHNDESRESIDLPIVSSSSSVGSLLLEVGDGIVSLGHTSTLAGGASWLTHLTVLEVDPVPAPMVFGGSSVAVLDASAATWPSFQAPDWTALTLSSRGRHGGDEIEGHQAMSWNRSAVWFPAAETLDWEGPFYETESALFSGLDEEDVWDGRWSWMHTPWVVWSAPSQRLERSLELWPSFIGERKNLIVEMGITELSGPGGASREVARGRLCIESGNTGFLLFGDLVTLPRAYDVDVATGATIAHPRVATVFDGLYLRAAADGPGDTVQVSVASSRLTSRDDVTVSSNSPGTYQRPKFALGDARAKVPTDGQRRVIAELDGSFDRTVSRLLWVSVHAR